MVLNSVRSMAGRHALMQLARWSGTRGYHKSAACLLSDSNGTHKPPHPDENSDPHTTHFGFKSVPKDMKVDEVYKVFKNVAEKYDLMNDVMSAGVHRLWKDEFVSQLSPLPGTKLIDVAGGTGDIAFRFLKRTFNQAATDSEIHVTVCDINDHMLKVGEQRALEHGYTSGIRWLQGNAECLPVDDGCYDAYTIAFGIRNCTNVKKVGEYPIIFTDTPAVWLGSGNLRADLVCSLGGRALGLSYPIGVCSYLGGLIVCNSGESSVVYFKYELDGSIHTKKTLESKFKRPSAAAVDRDNSLFIKDDVYIRKYDDELTLLKAFGDNRFRTSRPYGLSITSDNCLVTMVDCGTGKGVPSCPSIMTFSTEGHLLSTMKLKLPLQPNTKLRFMAVADDLMYISDLGASYVFAVDMTSGQLKKCIASPGRQPGQFHEPSGIACDRDGNLLIGDSKANRIQVFDEGGNYRSVLECEADMVRPSGIHLSADDTLYVVNYLAHKVLVYKLSH